MNCEFEYCIYNKDSLCILEEIGIDDLGMCGNCIMVSIIDEDLQRLKSDHLEMIKSRQLKNSNYPPS